eukprot:1365735-Rhodomonas_salina.1
MSASRQVQWKDNKIPKLEGTKTTNSDSTEKEEPPTTEQQLTWSNSVKKKLNAHGLEWIPVMAALLVFHGCEFQPICDPNTPDQFRKRKYKQQVINMAVKAGISTLPLTVRPTNVNNYEENYEHIKSRIACFSAQLDDAAKHHHPEIFTPDDENALPDPLAGLKEWTRLHNEYHKHTVLDSGMAWTNLMETLSWTDCIIEPNSIKTWTSEISACQKELLLAKANADEVDRAIVTSVLKKLQHNSKTSTPTVDQALWVTRAEGMLRQHVNQKYTWRALRQDIDQFCIDDTHEHDSTNENTPAKRRRTQAPAGIAMYTLATLLPAKHTLQGWRTRQHHTPRRRKDRNHLVSNGRATRGNPSVAARAKTHKDACFALLVTSITPTA